MREHDQMGAQRTGERAQSIVLISVVMDSSGLVLAANLFADAVRDAFDPRLNRE
jgi:ABC-type dipeptide/oligopeptide/nickel transport system permease subunit